MPGGEQGIRKRTVRDQLADKLSYMIHSGLLQSGDDLPSERELSNTLKVSRESVRSAIAVLADRGMVEVSQGSRTRIVGTAGLTLVDSVRSMSALKTQHPNVVNEAREQIEAQVIRLATARISEADLKHMHNLVDAQKQMLNDPVAFQISDREFHSTLYAACGNPLLTNFVSDLYDYALDFRRQALQRPNTITQSVQDHERIVKALGTRNAQKAEQALVSHLEHIHQSTEAVMNPASKAKRKGSRS
ncbi:FadR/GntR family transcriptional regulator [Limnohabitans sp.]|uniref:FadR/GntR family transcriptional regulator n=1 Tax=Limnohabitans sp. TaxID=1907725 RepID=UPI00286F92A9|nr:FadR/GntR family transcriptional regulator [Limnohabitans sp.]